MLSLRRVKYSQQFLRNDCFKRNLAVSLLVRTVTAEGKVDNDELTMNRVTLLSKAAYFTNSGQDALPGMGEEWPFLMGRLGP